jgi:hypothetical protein
LRRAVDAKEVAMPDRFPVRVGLSLFALLALAQPAPAQQSQQVAAITREIPRLKLSGVVQVFRICVRDIVVIEPEIVPVPVGCEVIDWFDFPLPSGLD